MGFVSGFMRGSAIIGRSLLGVLPELAAAGCRYGGNESIDVAHGFLLKADSRWHRPNFTSGKTCLMTACANRIATRPDSNDREGFQLLLASASIPEAP